MGQFEWLSDEAWAAIEPHVPKNRPGARRVDDRRVLSGTLHVLKSGYRWRDCPAVYGPPTTIYNRYNRWSAQGIGQKFPRSHRPRRKCLFLAAVIESAT